MNIKNRFKLMPIAFPVLAALVLAVGLLTGCAGKAPSLGKTPASDAQAFYEQGRSAEYNGEYKAAADAYGRAVRGGLPEASLALANLYETDSLEGVSEKERNSAIVKLTTDAAEAGHTPAMFHLANIYKDGRYAEKDTVKATEWLTRAAEAGDMEAMTTLAEGYRKLCGCGPVCACGPDCPAKAALWPVEQDIDQAVYWFKRAAEKENTYAACILGEIYSEGIEAKLNYAEAAKWYALAAENGSSTGENNLANLYLVGQGVPKDHAKAAELYTRAMEGSAGPTARYNLAELKLYAAPPFRNYKEAVPAIKAAAENGDTYAQVTLGEMYETGRGVKRDYKEAAKWYRSAADYNRAEAMVALGEMYRTGRGVPVDYVQAKEYFEHAVELYNYWGYRGLGKLYANGQGVPRDEAKAKTYYLKGAEKGDQEAMFLLAEILEHSGYVQSAREWYRAAADYTINELPRASYTRDFDVAPIAVKSRAALQRLGG